MNSDLPRAFRLAITVIQNDPFRGISQPYGVFLGWLIHPEVFHRIPKAYRQGRRAPGPTMVTGSPSGCGCQEVLLRPGACSELLSGRKTL